MYRIMNQSSRSFIVKTEQVLKGGKVHGVKGEKIIPPGKEIVEVTNDLGKSLSNYAGIDVVEIVKDTKGK